MSLLELQSDPAAFRTNLLIDTDCGPQPFKACVDDWQAKDFAALDDGWKRAVFGSDLSATYQRAWLERGRGHSKTSDLAVMSAYALFAARRPISGVAAAADRDQAGLLRNSLARLCYCNPWLDAMIEVQNYRVVNKHTGSTLEIISSDAPTSYGLLCDFVICDEVVHWKKRDLWDSLISTAAKRSTCIFVVITNAGISGVVEGDEWQWTTREAVCSDPSWYFSRLDGPVASWITPKLLEEQQRLLPPSAYKRLWLNEWVNGGGDALRPEDINAAFKGELHSHTRAVRDFEYVAGIDAGVARDASAICVLGIRRDYRGHGIIRLAYTKVWLPTPNKRVDLGDVETELLKCHERFDLRQINYDPWELRSFASRIQASGVGRMAKPTDMRTNLPLVEITPTGQNLQRVASAVLEAFNDRRLELYEEPTLRRDVTRWRVEERSYGFRLTSPRDQFGHGDLGSAFGMAVLAATEIASHPIVHLRPWGQHTQPSLPEWQQQLHDNKVLSEEEEAWRSMNNDACSPITFCTPSR